MTFVILSTVPPIHTTAVPWMLMFRVYPSKEQFFYGAAVDRQLHHVDLLLSCTENLDRQKRVQS